MINRKSAIVWGIILWALIFVVFSIIMFSPSLLGKDMLQKEIELVVLPILVLFAGYMYFLSDGAVKSEKSGFIVGLYFIIVSTILDLIITIPLFVKSYGTFYYEWSIWAGFLEIVIVMSLLGYYLGKRSKSAGKISNGNNWKKK